MNPTNDIEGMIRGLRVETRPATDERTLAAASAALAQSTMEAGKRDHRRFRLGRMIMTSRLGRIAAILIVTASIAAGVVWMTVGNGTTVAWADVQARMRRIHTLGFKMVMQMGEREMIAHVTMIEPGLIRQEMSVPQKQVRTTDLRKGRILILLPETKQATLIEVSGLPKAALEELDRQNMIRRLKELVEGSHVELGEKEINGRTAKGYRVERDDQTMTVWVARDTAEPIEMSITHAMGPVRICMSDFELDPDVDRALFSTEVPEGYTVQEMPKVELKEPAFEDIAVLLRILAMMKEDAFPDELPTEPSIEAFRKDLYGFDRLGDKLWKNKEEAYKVTLAMGRGIMFLAKIHQDATYAGKGVKLGDSKTAIFWYKPPEAEKYRVIYGDLSIKEVAPEDLPKK